MCAPHIGLVCGYQHCFSPLVLPVCQLLVFTTLRLLRLGTGRVCQCWQATQAALAPRGVSLPCWGGAEGQVIGTQQGQLPKLHCLCYLGIAWAGTISLPHLSLTDQVNCMSCLCIQE